jgi:hypothetical protein
MSTNEELLARIAALEARVEDLVTNRRTTMRDDHECPVCGGIELLHVKDTPEKLRLGSTEGVFATVTGHIELWVCRECLFIEHTARTLDDLHIDGKRIVAVSGEDSSASSDTPYR